MSAASQHTTRNNKHRYRKIALKIWGDEKFASLSPMPPSGQSLWVFLLAYPAQDGIPGVYRAGRASMAEQLGWEVEDFDRCFEEIADLGMAVADWSAKLVWLPNAAKFNPPESPNVVIWWSKSWPEIPECDMKSQIYETLRAHVYATGESYGKEFDKHFSKPAVRAKAPAKASGKASDKAYQKPGDNKASDKTYSNGSDKPSDKAFTPAVTRGSGDDLPANPRHNVASGSPETENPHGVGVCKPSDKPSDKGCPNHEQEHIHKQEHMRGEEGVQGEIREASPSAPSLRDHPVPDPQDRAHVLQGELGGFALQAPEVSDEVEAAVRVSQTKTGTRLPVGYALAPQWLTHAKKIRPDLPDEQIKTAADSFVAHWSAKPGKDGLKLNWLSTWLNWIRKERTPFAGQARQQSRLVAPSKFNDEETVRKTREIVEKFGAQIVWSHGDSPGG